MIKFTMNMLVRLPFESQAMEQSSYHVTVLVCSGLLSLLYLINVLRAYLFSVKAPVVGYKSILEPAWLVRLRFIRGSRSIIKEGYQQVSKNRLNNPHKLPALPHLTGKD
jgi:hypothetical protein